MQFPKSRSLKSGDPHPPTPSYKTQSKSPYIFRLRLDVFTSFCQRRLITETHTCLDKHSALVKQCLGFFTQKIFEWDSRILIQRIYGLKPAAGGFFFSIYVPNYSRKRFLKGFSDLKSSKISHTGLKSLRKALFRPQVPKIWRPPPPHPTITVKFHLLASPSTTFHIKQRNLIHYVPKPYGNTLAWR